MTFASVLMVAAGSALGGLARYWCTSVVSARYGVAFPLGTLLVNIAGCGFIGLFAALTGPDGRLLVSPLLRQFVMIGFCGGYTTFSSFGLETLNLAREGEFGRALLNAGASLILCLAAVLAGHLLGTALNQTRGG